MIEQVADPGRHRRQSFIRNLTEAYGRRLAIFSGVGLLVFIAGTALQWLLMREHVLTSDQDYAWQTAFSVELAFVLNWAITFRDRHAPVVSSLVKWNIQKAVLTIPNCLLYDVLVHSGMGWLKANVIATGAFTLINFVVGNFWSFTPAKLRISPVGTLIAAVILGIPVASATIPQLRVLIYIGWMMPCIELVLLVIGTQFYRHRFRENESRFERVIIQVTTRGNEPERVSQIVREIKGFHLGMPHAVWVVTEPADQSGYHDADLVLHVPVDFSCKATRKGRALEYSRRVRQQMGLAKDSVKIIFVDDDVSLTRSYIETAFRGDYDVSEGIVTPRTGYGFRPLGHFIASHADDIRTQNCLVYCSVFQGIFGRPLHVHGEGLTTTGRAESIVTWDRHCLAEDLSYGQIACKMGLKWGWFHEYVETTSAWSLRDYITQHARWLWGDGKAIRSRDLMGWGAAMRDTGKYLQGILALSCSAVGLWLRFTGKIPSTEGILNFGKLAMIAWVAMFFSCGWIAAGSAHSKRSDDSRMLSGVLAVLMMPVSALLTWVAIIVPLVQGDPGDFKMIRKTR